VNLVDPATAAAAGIVLFVMPGLVFLALLGARERDNLRFDEALYLLVAVSVMASAWVALVLAEAGRFSLVAAAGLLAAVCVLALFAGRRRLASPLPPWGGLRDIVPALVVLALAFALQARPSEYLLGGRDPGTYVGAMGMIARTGSIAYTDPVVLSIPPQDVELFYRNSRSPDFNWGRFMGFPLENPRTGRVFPEFFHLFPSFGAYLFQAMGVKGALATPPVFGILGTLGVFFALRRLFGEASGLLAALLLASNVVQVWFARYPVSEPVSQFLVFVALLALWHWEERGSPFLGALFGAALGLSFLVRIDSVLLLAPLALYLLVRLAHRDLSLPRAAAALLPSALLLLHAGFHSAFFARKYLVNIASRPYWQQPVGVWVVAALACVAALVTSVVAGPRLVRLLESHVEALRTASTGLVVVLAAYAYFLRPSLSAWAGGDGNDPALAWGNPGVLATLGFRRLAAHDAQALVRLGWFVTPLALALAVFGLLLAIQAFKPRRLFLLLTFLTFSAFYFYKIRIYNDYYFALRRFVPVVLPCLLGFAAFALVRLAARGGRRRLAAAGLSLVLFAAFARDTARIAAFTDWKNAVRFVDDVSRHFGADDVVIFEQAQSIHLLSLPLWAVHGVNVLELARFNPDPEKLRDLVMRWRTRYRNIYFVNTYRTDLCGLFLNHVEDYAFGTYEWERAYGRPPEKPEFRSLRFTISRVVPPEDLSVPPLREVDIGGSDDFQVSGFFDKEGSGSSTFRWTGSCASVYLPGARGGDTLVLTASGGPRPADRPAATTLSLSGTAVGAFTAGEQFDDYSFRLPPTLPPGPPVLRFDVRAWRPANVVAGSADTRDLGVMIERIRMQAAGAGS
jgi:Dolichyl-phosphate-mannose-protein mannosyltransferase